MKLTLTLLLVLVIFSIAVALKCLNKGNSRGAEVLEMCPSANDKCGTVARHSTDEKMENIAKTTTRTCLPSAFCDVLSGRTISVTFDLVHYASSVQCCNTDGCNSARLDFPDVGKPNGQQCKACTDLSGRVCNKTVQCFGAQDHCYEANRQPSGCMTSNLCTLSQQQYEDIFHPYIMMSGQSTCSKTSPYNSAIAIRLGLFPLLLGPVVLSVN